VGDAISQADDVSTRSTGTSGARSGRTGGVCTDGFGLDQLLLRGSLPDVTHRDCEFIARRIEAWSGVHQAAAGATPGNSGSTRGEVSSGTLRGEVAPVG